MTRHATTARTIQVVRMTPPLFLELLRGLWPRDGKCDREKSEKRTGLPHQQPAGERNRRAAVPQQLVVERLPGRAAAAGGRPVVAQLPDHQLAQRVVEIGRI